MHLFMTLDFHPSFTFIGGGELFIANMKRGKYLSKQLIEWEVLRKNKAFTEECSLALTRPLGSVLGFEANWT